MKYIKIKIGDYDIDKLQEIFEKESSFNPICSEDSIIIEIMRQCIDEDNIIEEIEEKTTE